MPRTTPNSFYSIAKNHKIFIIICKKTNEFFVHFSSAQRLDKTFSRHYNLKNSCTAKMFSLYKETIYCPEMYQFEEILCTGEDAYVRQLLWIRYFLSLGYTCLNYPHTIEDAKNIYEERYSDYKEIKKIKVEDILSTANRRCGNYGRQRQEVSEDERNGKRQIKIICDSDEYEIIKANAKANDLTVSAYLREVALQGKVLDINYHAIIEHKKEINHMNNLINLVLELFVSTGEIYDSDIEKIYSAQKNIKESSAQLLESFLKHTKDIRKTVRKELQKKIM